MEGVREATCFTPEVRMAKYEMEDHGFQLRPSPFLVHTCLQREACSVRPP